MLDHDEIARAMERVADGFEGLTTLRDDDRRVGLARAGIDEWDWEIGVGLYGYYRGAALSSGAAGRARQARLVAWYDRHIRHGLPHRQVNSTSPMLCLALLARDTGNENWRALVEDWASWLYEHLPRTAEGGFQHVVKERPNEGQLWDDTLFMAVLFLGFAGRWLQRPEWVEEAYYQFLVHARFLADPVSGLWYHGWTFNGRHNYAKAFWARGNSWFTVAVPAFLQLVGQEFPPAARLITTVYARQVEAVAALQLANGMWPTLLDQQDSPPEASATAGIACGILSGVRQGLIPESYRSCALRAAGAVLSRVGTDGMVQDVSGGTPMGYDLDFYRAIPYEPTQYGQGLVSLLLVELLSQTDLVPQPA